MNFGLGLVLSFTDNATAGINNAVNSLSQLTQVAENASSSLDQMASLSALSVVSNKLGSSFLNTGGTIISTLGQIIGKVNQTGQTLMYAESQLDALYANSGKTGKDVISQIQEYAKTSMFEFENLIPAVTSLKSVGIEAFDAITSSTGNAQHSLLDYASALASFAPQMRNAYGTGINAAIGAMREYIAEGNARSLKSGAGLDITGILGEEKGATIEERTRQVADLIETLNMMPMVEAMSNSPMTQLSNMGDTLFQLLGMISDSGVYDKFTELIGKLSSYISAIPEEELQSIASSIGSALTTIMTPLEWVIDKLLVLADGVRKLVANNPNLIKFATVGIAITGVLLVLAGVALKATSAFSGLSLMLLTSGKSFSSLSGIIKTGSLKILGTLLPLTATIGLLALAWKSDFAGIRTNVTYFMNNLVNSFNTARNAVNGNVEDLKTTLKDLNSKDDFFSNLTIGLMEVMMLFKAVADGWNDFTLSEDNYEKAKELGILPLVEAILDLKYRFDFFKQGFIDGWKEIGENVKTAISGFLDNIEGTAFESLVDNLTEFLQKLASGDTQAWYDFGNKFAEFTAKALALWVAFKAIVAVVGKVVEVVTKVATVFKTIYGYVAPAVKAIASFFAILFTGGQGTTVLTGIAEVLRAVFLGGMHVKDAMWVVFGTMGKVITVVSGVFTTVAGAFVAIFAFIKQLKEGFSWVWEIVKWVGIAIAVVGAIIAGVSAWPAVIVGVIVGAIMTIIVLVKQYWTEICNFFSTIGTWIYDNVIAPVVNFFSTYIFPIISKIAEIVAKIIEIIVVLVGVAVQWIKTNVIDPIAEWFTTLWNNIVEGVTSFIEKAKIALEPIVTWIKEHIIDPITEFFSAMWEGIKTAFNVVADTISGVLKGAVNTVLSFICGVINNVITSINWAIDVINAIPGVSITKIEMLEVPQLAQGGIVDKPTLSVVGEAGTEAVMPLENNTGWIGVLSRMIASQIDEIRPTSTGQMNTVNNQGDTNQKYLTNNNTSTQTIQGDTDNSVVFNEGAIQVTVQNASEEEAIRLAQKVMGYIKRQQELDEMLNYA